MAKKYIDADRLRAEIDQRILQEQGFEDGDAEYGYKCALKDIKRDIPSLQQEQPSFPSNLDEAAEEWVRPIMRTPSKAQEYLYTYLLDAFKKGAEWMAQVGKEVDLEKELEEEIERFYRTDEYRIADTLGRGFETLARHFAEWGAKHLKR